EVKVDDKLHFIEEPIEILNRGVKKLKRRWIPTVKVRWNSRRGPEFTWEREEEMKRNQFVARCGNTTQSWFLRKNHLMVKEYQENDKIESKPDKKGSLPVCYDDDDDEERSDSLDDNIISGLPPFSAITPDEPVLSAEEPDNSLSMGDEHLDTIPTMESNEVIKSSVEDLILIPSESEGIPDHRCDVPSHDNSSPLDVSTDQIERFSESNEEFSSIDDDLFSIDNIDYVEASPPDFEVVSSEVMEIVIPEVDAFLAVEDEPTSSQFPKSYLDPEGDMLPFEAFLNNDHTSNFKTKSSSTSLNSLLEETSNFDNSLPEFTTFSNDLFDAKYEFDSSDDQSCSDEDVLEKIFSKPLCEEEIIHMKSLRTHDSSLSISSKIDSLLDEFAGELTLLKSISSRIDETDCDFEEDIRLIEKLLYDNSSPRPSKEFVSANSDAESESFSPSPILVKDSDSLIEEIDLFCTPDYPMPPGIVDKDYDSERDILIHKDLPSNDTLSFAEKESFHFDIPPFSRPLAKPLDGDTGILNIKMMGDISDQKAFMHKLMITLAPHQEKYLDLLSHRCGTIKKFNTHRSHLNTCPMMIHGQNNPPLDVKEYQEKDKIGSKPDKNRKRGEAGKSQKQLQWIKQEKLKKMQKEGPEMQSPTKFIRRKKEQGLFLQFNESSSIGA
nr:putative reverse transcriptase domain-containing protein [Tanacetum cinerariifolium]